MRRFSSSSLPCRASKYHAEPYLSSGIGSGHSSLPTTIQAFAPFSSI
jgi:hypothetical protein